MAKSTISQLEYKHEPNHLVSFIKYQCTLEGNPIKIDRSEQSFINEVYNPNQQVVKRQRGRQSGGSTLMALIGLYYIAHKSKDVLYYAPNQTEVDHFYQTTLDLIDVLGFEKKFGMSSRSRNTVYLQFQGGPETSRMKSTSGASGAGVRGHQTDIILADNLLVRRKKDLETVHSTLFPALNPGGKIILNITAGP